jgi:hypothetical protein
MLVFPPVGEVAPYLLGELQPTKAESAKATERASLDFIASTPVQCINKFGLSLYHLLVAKVRDERHLRTESSQG